MRWLNKRLYHSQFGGLWIDRLDAEDRSRKKRDRGRLTEDEYENVLSFLRDGYVVLRNAVPESVVDALRSDIDAIPEKNPYANLLGNYDVRYTYATRASMNRKDFRGFDFHVNSSNIRDAIFSERIERFLRIVFDRDILARQTLYFSYGSQQEMHQDTAYVVCSSPLQMAATWLALEDIEEGTGELIYFRGSHRYPDFIFGGKHKEWDELRDGPDQHEAYLESLHTNAATLDCPMESFLAKKGDVLVWAADLAHGGAPITLPGRTRKSLVTHYCPLGVRPRYFEFGMDDIAMHRPHCFYSSSFYRLKGDVADNGSREPYFMKNLVLWTSPRGQTCHLIARPGTSVKTKNERFVVSSRQDDLGFYLETREIVGGPKVTVRASVESEVNSLFQVYYLRAGRTDYTEEDSVAVPIERGWNEIELNIDQRREDPRLRIDPGHMAGKFVFKDLEIAPRD